MSAPTIVVGGTNSGIFIITDHEGSVYRVPIASYPVVEFTNGSLNRVQIKSQGETIVLLFESTEEMNVALAVVDAEY